MFASIRDFLAELKGGKEMLFCSKIIDFIAFGEHFPQYQRKGMYTASRQPSLTLVSMAYLGNNLDWLHLYNEWKATIDKQFD